MGKNSHKYSVLSFEEPEEKPYKGANLSWCAARKCIYLSGPVGKGANSAGQKTCDYILRTGHPRPCPAGAGCTACKPARQSYQKPRDNAY